MTDAAGIARRLRRAAITCAVVALIYGAGILLMLPRDDDVMGQFAAVMALGSGVRPDGSLDANGAERLRKATAVARAVRAPLYMTRVRTDDPPYLMSDSAQMRILRAEGITDGVLLEGLAWSTRDEAERLRKALPAGRIVVVTSRLHTRRACAAFERVGYEVTCVASAELPRSRVPYRILYESAALIEYWLRDWI